jgi:hypothetical protein
LTWDRCKPFLSYIRAAVRANLPPKQVIFNNPAHKEYDFWDLRLLKAYYLTEDFTRDGIPLWWDESDDVFFEVEKRVSRSKAAVQRAEKGETGKDREPPLGRYYVPVPKTRGGAPLPSLDDWQEELARKKGKK